MLECISIDYPNNLSFYDQRASFVDRKKLRSMLLARRNALRVICAPSLYGKSVLAFQYADQAFHDEEVNWIDAADPSFILALDEGMSSDFAAQYLDPDRVGHEKSLFVFDGCPYLDEERFSSLSAVIASIIAVGHEVLLTTDDTRWLRAGELRRGTLDAGLLLVDEREAKAWAIEPDASSTRETRDRTGAKDVPTRADKLLYSIAGCRAVPDHARERFFASQLALQVEDEVSALSLIMLVLRTGALHELRSYATDLTNASLTDLERQYPHVGITALSPRFDALELTERERFLLIQHHLTGLVSHLSAFTCEDDLLKTLIDHLIERDAVSLATQLASGWHDDEARTAFFDRYGRSFLFSGKALVLLQVAKTLPHATLAANRRWFTVAAALALVDRGDETARFMRSLHRMEESGALADPFFSAELDQALARIVFSIDEEHDPAHLASLAASCMRRYRDQRDPAQTSRPVFSCDMSEVIAATLHDPCEAYGVLQRIASAGYAIKQTMIAMSIFLSLTDFVWEERFTGPAKKGFVTRRNSAMDKRPVSHGLSDEGEWAGMLADASGDEQRMLASLEGQLVHILSRQATTLSRNICELHLFDAARRLFGERIYLRVDDAVLGRVDTLRQTLATQRDRWREHRLSISLFDLDAVEDKRLPEKTEKKALRINTLGRFEIEPCDPDITVKNKVRKQLRLLISLLAINEGREIARPWVQRTMWPDAPERNARQNLYTMWSLLNKSGIDKDGHCPFFESYPQSLALNSSLVETDTPLLDSICKRLRYEKLDIPLYERAIGQIEALYRGPLLPGEETAEVVAHRKKYQDRLIEALMKGGETLRKSGETRLALRYFRFAFDNEPTREDVCYQLMLVLWKLGRHGEALGEYFVCRRALIDSYGIEGSRKLRELYETILRDAS